MKRASGPSLKSRNQHLKESDSHHHRVGKATSVELSSGLRLGGIKADLVDNAENPRSTSSGQTIESIDGLPTSDKLTHIEEALSILNKQSSSPA